MVNFSNFIGASSVSLEFLLDVEGVEEKGFTVKVVNCEEIIVAKSNGTRSNFESFLWQV